MIKTIPRNIHIAFKVYALAIGIFFVFRLILFLLEVNKMESFLSNRDVLLSFIMGLRFDLVICGYLMVLPFLLLTIYSINKNLLILKKVSFYFILILFTLAFFVCAADIPYYNQFHSRFSVTAFEWMGSPIFVLKMIVGEPRYWLYIIPFSISIYLFFKFLKKIFLEKEKTKQKIRVLPTILLSVACLFIMMVGIRGRLARKSPIRTGTAYFSNNPFLNQLGLNPNFTLIRSYLDKIKEENKPIALMDNNTAIKNIQRYFGFTSSDMKHPLQRTILADSAGVKRNNVVIIIMESMSAGKMHRHGNKGYLTPFLDSLSKRGYYFENTFTAGIHTFNGIFSTLFSFPALFRQHPMKGSSIPKYHGIGTTLKKDGYSTIYFTTHDGQFDNVEGFLKANDYDEVISEKDYPNSKIKSALGVPDDYMFEYSIPEINSLSKKQNPFLAVFMTASDHGPYYVPSYFKPYSKDIKDQIVEYADYSLHKFITLASQQPWFNNTLFVFVADHGAPLDNQYEVSLNYNHSPLIFYSPTIIPNPKSFSQMAGQIDIYPTIMGLLGLPYVNNTLGIDLLKHQRPYIFFNADDKYAVINQEWLLIVRKDKFTGLFHYNTHDLTNYAEAEKDTVEKMKTYAESHLQAYQHVLETGAIK